MQVLVRQNIRQQRACELVGLPRSSPSYRPHPRHDERLRERKSARRQEQLFKFIGEQGEPSVEALAAHFGVSPITIRRDLTALERRKLVTRTWGGVRVAIPIVYGDEAFEGGAVKRAIAIAASGLVEPGMVLAISGGSTCTELARRLRGQRVRVLTNALNVALELRSTGHTRVMLTGGELNAASYELVGELVARSLSEYRVDLAFVGCSGVTPDFGFCMRDEPEAGAARAITQAAGRVVVLADHGKAGQKTFARFARLGEVERLITDDGLDNIWRGRLVSAGLRVDLAPTHAEG